MKRTLPILLGAALALGAQTQDTFEVRVPPPGAGVHIQTLDFVRGEFGPVGPVVKSAPYTAEAVTENVQVLADGNRIVHKDASQVARDSEGRTRRDLAVPAMGPLAAKVAPKLSVIFDPVTNISYTLDHNSKTARKTAGRGIVFHSSATTGAPAPPPPGATEEKRVFRVEVDGPGPRMAAGNVLIEGPGPMRRTERKFSGKTESLGKQNIDGVMAEGTRTTDVIPAGEMGNERPIEIVSERWYSPELQTVIMTRHKDPRMGESTYKLTNIRRSEPLKSLFEVPVDYTVKEAEMPR